MQKALHGSSAVEQLQRHALGLAIEVARLRAQVPALTGSAGPHEIDAGADSPAPYHALLSVVQKTRMPLILCDPHQPDDPIVFANRAFLALSGYSAAEVLGRNCRFLIGPETDPAQVARIGAAMAAREELTIEVTVHRRDGTPIVVELFISPVVEGDGRLRFYFGSLLDVTANRRVRAQLEASEQRHRAIFDSSVDFAIIATDRDGRVTDWNAGAERVLGWSAAEMAGNTLVRFFTAEDRAADRIAREMRQALETGRASDERWHLRKDGTRFWASGELMPLRNADGTHLGFVKVLRDRTAEHRAGRALKEAEERLRRAQEAGRVGVFSVGVDDDVLHPTAAFCRLYGLPERSSFPAEEAERLVLPEDAALRSDAARRRRGDAPGDAEYRIRRADTGEIRWIARTAEFERDAEGRPTRFLGVVRDITEQRAARAALEESQARLQQALSAGRGIGTWDWDVVADRVRADERFARLYGVDPAIAAHGAPIADFFAGIHPDDVGRVQPAIEAALRTGDVFSEEYRLVQEDGTVRWVVAEGQCKRAADGTPLRFPGVSFDITDRKRAEARQAVLLELGDRLRDSADPADLAFAAAAIIGRTFAVSRAGYGDVDEAAQTLTIERDWHAPGLGSLAGTLRFSDDGSSFDDLKRGETVALAHAEADSRNGVQGETLKALGVQAVVNVPVIEQGRFVALLYASSTVARTWAADDLALMRDVAERVHVAIERARLDKARRESEEQFRVFAEAVPNHVWAARPDGDLYWFNEQVYAYSGEPAGSLTGTSEWARIVAPEDLPGAAAEWGRSLANGTVYETEFRIRRADGAYRWFLVRAEPVRSPDGGIVRWVGTNTDIDDRKRQAAELARLNDTLEEQVAARTRELMVAEAALRQSQKMEAVGQLTGGLAHDFNNLLTGIIGNLELLNTRIAQGRVGEIERYTTAAQGAAKRAAALTHRLLAFSRRQTLDPKATDVNRLVAGMEDLVRRTVGPAIAVEIVAAGGLWPTLVDPNQLENALLNLCINARDAMPDGGRLTVETANRWLDARSAREDLPPGQYVSLCVSDTGTGMTPEVIAKAFDPFFTTKPLGMGTGLGLSMIYGFARQSGGWARIYSEVGQGTMVSLYLPRHLGAADEGDTPAEPPQTPRANAGETVLVVDDEPTVRMLVIEVLEELGYAAIEAADGASGLAVLQSAARVDLLVTDVGLPGGMNGRQMVDAARLGRPTLKVLFITGYAENAVVGNGHLDPGMHVMTKPFAMDALAARIKDLIAGT